MKTYSYIIVVASTLQLYFAQDKNKIIRAF